jgi:hypothetical protein
MRHNADPEPQPVFVPSSISRRDQAGSPPASQPWFA